MAAGACIYCIAALRYIPRKTAALMCASQLEPDNTKWEDYFQDAKAKLKCYFPRYGIKQLLDECCICHYTDVDDEEHVWVENSVCPWNRGSLPYLHRARRLLTGFDASEPETDT